MRRSISIVVPCFNEEENVPAAYLALKKVFLQIKKYSYELVFVDNGSLDKTKIQIHKLVKNDKNVKGVYLSRNFGPEASIQAGCDYVTGDALIVYECDMQDPPEIIPLLIKKWEEGFDIVAGVRTKAEENAVMWNIRKLFYKIFHFMSNIDVPVDSGSFALIGRKAYLAMKSLPEKYRFFRGLRAWVGFRVAYVKYERKARIHGVTSANIFQYVKLAERSFFGFSYLPLDVLVYAGFFLTVLSFLFIIGYLLFFFSFGNPIKGAVTILVAIVFFGGINLLAVSVIGKYIQVIVEETKSRPTYIVERLEGRFKKQKL